MCRRRPPRRRLLYTAAYALMAGGGIAASVWPARSVSNAAGALNALILLWSAFLIVGGLCSAYGSYTDRWIGEYSGLPLLASVFAVYGVAALAVAPTTGWTSLAGGLAFVAISTVFVARWAEVASVRRHAVEQATDRRNDGLQG